MHVFKVSTDITLGSAVDDGSPVGLLSHGLHLWPPEAMADSQPLPGPLEQAWYLGIQGLPVGALQVHEREVWAGRFLVHA